MKQITGWHVLGVFVACFGVIIAVNLTLAFNAVRSFPGLEVKNSYVASQHFDTKREAQTALGWSVGAWLEDGTLHLSVEDGLGPVVPTIETAVFGRATTVASDQTPAFRHDGVAFVAPVMAHGGNWNLRVTLRAVDGTQFQQRIIVRHAS